MFCKSVPRAEVSDSTETPEPEPVITEETVSEPEISEQTGETPLLNNTVSQEVYIQTLDEIKVFIEHLNDIIRSKNFNSWKGYLSNSYYAKISSHEFLAEQSNTPAMKTLKKVLRTPNDYFNEVVVPSRANSRVDEIEFSAEIVKAYYFTPRSPTGRVLLYELQKNGNEWKIISN